jgi:hypothetical protein
LVSEERPVADEFPAFASVALSREGGIWIREYAKPREAEANRWIVFDSDGRYQCHVDLPAVDQVLEFGRDYLLALYRDE